MLVRQGHRRARITAARFSATMPPVGSSVIVDGTVGAQGEVEAESVENTGTDTGGFSVEGAIVAIDTSTRTLTISADDNSQSGSTIAVVVSTTLDLSKFTVGQEVELQVTLQPDGTYLLQGSASDEGVQGADDQEDLQGDQGDGPSSDSGTQTDN